MYRLILKKDRRHLRRVRHHVLVDGVRYRSVRAAFIHFELPLGNHETFRVTLKERGELEWEGRIWRAVMPDFTFRKSVPLRRPKQIEMNF